jgi:hypothetical protein
VRRMPNGGGKVQGALPKAGRVNSTVPGEFGTRYSAGRTRHGRPPGRHAKEQRATGA